MRVLRQTRSLCPECLSILDAEVFERDDKVWIRKKCEEHGEYEELYWGSYEMYEKARNFASDGKSIKNPNTEFSECPKSCGLCKNHKSHTSLGNIVITNRCDLTCFYCFFYAKAMGYVYEPSLEQIRMMLRKLREEKPVPANAVQFTGGNPEVREDLVDIVKMAKEEGYDHVQLNINGTYKLAWDLEWAKKLRSAGLNTIYLSFDGVTEKTNPKNHWEIPRIFENCKKAGIGIVLVPVVIKGINDHELGDIIRFAIKNNDVVKAVNFQPVSLVGRIKKADRERMRITIPDAIANIENQTGGSIKRTDWYPIPTVTPITHLIEAITGEPKYQLSSHFACGMASYVFVENDKIIPITDFVDVEGLMKYLDEKSKEIQMGKNRLIASLKILGNIGKFIDKEKQPKGLDFKKILIQIAKKKGNYKALSELHRFHHKTLFLGMMHFQDLYNYDIERVERCCIHYAQPDGTIVPFCTFNVIPQWYRDKIQEKFSEPIPVWEKRTGKKLDDDFYKRDIAKLKAEPIYEKVYGKA